MKTSALWFASLLVAALASGCGRTGTICETVTDCGPGQTCSAFGCVDIVDGGLGGGIGGGGGRTGGGGGVMGGGLGGGGGRTGGGLGGGGGVTGGGIGGGTGGGNNCRPGQTQCQSGCTNLDIDLDNCGSCGRPCPEGANATASCSGGTCGLQCAIGFADCDRNPMNGCEANFSNPSTCGACTNICPAGPNALPTCGMGVCGLTCARGFGNCDFFSPNGCEADLSAPGNCGTCGNVCRSGPNQDASCVLGMCGAQCRPGFADCDMFPGNGCEANLASAATCGSCSNACPSGGPNTMATCTMSTCGSQCRPGFGNCDGSMVNGCETDLNSPATCGSCTTVCPVGLACTGGMCGNCPAPAVGTLSLNTTVMGNLPSGPARFPLPSCSMQSNRAEDLWTFNLATPTIVTFETAGGLDTVLMVRSSCSATTDLGCNDDTPGIGAHSRVTLSLQAGTYSVLVKPWGGMSMGGSYSLSATTSTTAPNAVCNSAIQLTSGLPVRNQDSATGGALSSACEPTAGGQLFYRLLVPGNQRAVVTVTPTGGSNMTSRLLNNCNAFNCLSSMRGPAPQVHTFVNNGPAPQNLIISVSATAVGVNGLFDVLAELGPLSTGNNITCAAAAPLVVNGMPFTGEVVDTGGPQLSSCLPAQTGRVRYYSVLVPGRSAVTVTGTPNVFDLGLRVFTSCAAMATCAAFSDGSPGAFPESVRITNPLNSSQTFIVAASSSFVGSGGTFTMSAATANPPAAGNAFCSTPTSLPPGIAIAGEQALPGGLPLTNVCLPSQTGYARYYSTVVPPGHTLHAVVSAGVTGLDVGARLLNNCSATSCVAASDSNQDPAGEALLVSNTASFPQTFIIAASTANTNPPLGSNFSVVANVVMTATNATCAGATPMTVGQTLPFESLAGGGPPNTSCLPTVTGLTKYYRVVAAPGERLNITVAPQNFDATVRVFDSCTASTCAGSANAATGFGEERVTLQNDTASMRTFVLAVSAPGTTRSGTFRVTVARSAYSVRNIMASCGDLSLAPDLLGPTSNPVLGDDVGTQTLSLPFNFPFFASPVSHYSACMNGFAQLFPGPMASPDCSFTNTTLPDSVSPNGMVALHWDDLFPVGPQTRIRSQVTGASPNRVFTIEWLEAAFLSTGPGPERMQFQAKLFETSGVIEFHYCSLQLNGGNLDFLTGSGSTIGLENVLGSDAVQHSFDAANSVSNGGGLRFVPQ